MNELSNRSRLPGAQVLWPVVAMVAFLTAFLSEVEPPLRTSRPQTAPSTLPLAAPDGVQSVPAKMWEDPLSVLSRLPKERPVAPADSIRELFERVVDEVTAPRQGRSNRKLLVLPVLVPGQPFESAVEDRIRTRYAVVSALQAMGFRLSYSERLTVTWIRVQSTIVQDGLTPVDVPIPLKLFTRDLGEPSRSDDAIAAVLVLWVSESALEKRPLHVLAQLLDGLFGPTGGTEATSDTAESQAGRALAKSKRNAAKLRLAVLGPFNSDTLADMLREDLTLTASVEGQEKRAVGPDPREWFTANFAAPPLLLSPRATVPLDYLDLPLGSGDRLEEFRKRETLNCGFRLIFTIGTDRQLGFALSRELRLRGAWPEDLAESVNSARHVILLYEQDSTYGRAFGRSLRNFIPRQNLHLFGYRRGLDGRSLDATKEEKPTGEDRQQIRNDDLPQGPSQYDYLRRIANEVAAHHDFLHDSGQGSIVAVGIVGTDVFDKLLILRALRHHLPKARFFTSDLDARLWHPSEYPFTRNIVVASHFGLGLNRKLRFDAPPFRDSYQTSAFLATLRALGSNDIEAVFASERIESARTTQTPAVGRWDPWGRGERSEESVLQPLVFEISRKGPYRLATSEVESIVSHDLQADRPGHAAGKKLLLTVLAIAALSAVLAFYFRSIERAYEAAHAALYLVTPNAAWRALGLPPPKAKGDAASGGSADTAAPPWPIGFLLTVGVLALAFAVILFDHNRLGGEPFTLTAGISVWPSVILRILCILVSVGLLYRCSAKLKALRKEYSKPGHADLVPDAVTVLLAKGRWGRRLGQAALYFLFGVLLFVATDTYPGTPYRGAVSFSVTLVTTLSAVFVVLLVSVFVLDCISKTRRLVLAWVDAERLDKDRDADRHEELGRRATRYIRDFAAFSDVVGHFVYYPFVVVLLLSASRIAFFDNWDMAWSLYVVMSLILGGVVVEVVRLRLAATRIRRYAVARMTDALENALTTNVEQGVIDTLRLRLGRINEERRGAFRPLAEDPIIIAVAIPFGGTGSLILLERIVGG